MGCAGSSPTAPDGDDSDPERRPSRRGSTKAEIVAMRGRGDALQDAYPVSSEACRPAGPAPSTSLAQRVTRRGSTAVESAASAAREAKAAATAAKVSVARVAMRAAPAPAMVVASKVVATPKVSVDTRLKMQTKSMRTPPRPLHEA